MGSRFERLDLQFKYRLLFPALSHMPRKASYRLASLYGRGEYRRDEALATQIAHQMSRAIPGLPEEKYREWTRYFYSLQQREILDTWYYPRLKTAEQVGQAIQVENFEQVLAARREGQPLIFAGAHLGRFWMLGVTAAAYGVPTSALARDDEENNSWGLPEPEFIYRKLKLSRLRQCYRSDFIMPGAANMRPLFQALQTNPVAILLDVPYTRGSPGLVGIPFFGREAYFPDGAVKIAKKAGALLQPFCVEEDRQRLTLRFLPVYEATDKSSEELLALMVGDIEHRIRLNPGRWWQWQALPMFWGEV